MNDQTTSRKAILLFGCYATSGTNVPPLQPVSSIAIDVPTTPNLCYTLTLPQKTSGNASFHDCHHLLDNTRTASKGNHPVRITICLAGFSSLEWRSAGIKIAFYKILSNRD
jgi:hypothetical protein